MMKRISLLGYLFFAVLCFSNAQNIFNPDDPIIRYDASKPFGSQQRPDTNKLGLQKWVSKPTIGVSLGVDTFNASSFKQYYINTNGGRMAFRIKFPKSYSNPDSASKKYPINMFLHGGGEVGCSTNGGIYNNEKQLWLGGKLHMQFVDQNKFDGFLLYPQLVVTNGCFFGWGSAATINYTAILSMIDSMAKYIRADIDRVVVDGLSGGGYGAWRFAEAFPKRIAKIMPSASAGSAVSRDAFVHIPIWFGTGGKDPDPSPEKAQFSLNRMKDIGADIRYTLYPERGHSMWEQHWREPDYVPSLNDVHKANPLVFFQRSEFCLPTDVNAKIGITGGFYAYEWQKDGITIATSTNGTNVIIDQSPLISFTGNEITVRSYGTYRVRFRRAIDADWSDWSPKPAVIKTKTGTQTAPIQINGVRSKVLPALDGSTTVPLTLPEGFVNYQWYRVSDDVLVSSAQTFDAPAGVYKARYTEQFGCGSDFSPPFTVVDANGSPKPGALESLSAFPVSQTIIKLNWVGGTGESGFEVYRSTASGGPYKFVARTPQDLSTFNDSNLIKNVVYYYIVRTVSETGASVGSNEAIAKTLIDNIPPTAPSNLLFNESSTPTAVLLTWAPSTDIGGIERYDIYVNGEKVYSVPSSGFTVANLDSLIPYSFVVKAVDSAGNVSPSSNQVTYLPPGTPQGPVPGGPSSVTATATAYNKISLTWTDTSASETGFEVVRALSIDGSYKPVATAAANATSFNDSGLVASTTYFYRIRAIGSNGESAFSEKVSAVTLAAPATPIAPTELSGEAGINNSISLSWTDNSNNETNFLVQRSLDNINFELIATLPANSNAYTDNSVTGLSYYYYYVAGSNASGAGAQSNTIHIKAGNNAPVINSLADIFVKAGSTASKDFSVTDDAGDSITVTIINKPAFVTAQNLANGNYKLVATPGTQDAGSYTFTVTATDNNGKASSQNVTISVGDKNARGVFLNFGSASADSAAAPWNNWMGNRADGDVISNLKDENNIATPISVTTVNAWSGTSDMGLISGDNTGIFPDAILASGLADNAAAKQIKISGLDITKQYNLVLAASYNEGGMASAEYSAGGQVVALNARYNTQQTVNLNNLSPDANGEIMLTITRTDTSRFAYLNGLAIEELDTEVTLLGPDNFYAEAVDRSTVKLQWSDRTNNEASTDGYELTRATDSAFTKDVQTITLAANSKAYTNTALSPNTKYWYRVRAKNGGDYSDYSKKVKVVTPETIIYVNFQTTVEDAPAPWNNLQSSPINKFTTPNLIDQSGRTTNISLSLTKEFNGENTSGMNTGNNLGVVPDNVLRSTYWLDKDQISQFRVNGLNHGKKYRFGFIGSMGPENWYKGNYTATYSVHDKTVYLNSWENSTKIVYLGDVMPDPDGKLLLNFSTTHEAGYGFNSGIIIEEYVDVPAQTPIDTIPNTPNPPDTIPNTPNPPDTIPNTPNPPDTIPNTPNPPDTIPNTPNPPIDTVPNTPNPPVDSIAEPFSKVFVYPNPVRDLFSVKFFNKQATDKIGIELYDPQGRLMFRRNYGTMPLGTTTILVSAYEANLRTGVFLMTLKANGKIVRSVKIVKTSY